MDDPAAMRRRLRVEMRRLRAHAKLTQREVADALEWSPSKIIRIESGQVGLSVTDLKALAGLYGIRKGAALDELTQLARGSRRQPFAEFKDVLTAETVKFAGYEASTSLMRSVQPLLVPGLLQTARYTRALLTAFGSPAARIERLVKARLKRQEIFARPGERQFFFILDEAVLHRPVGGAEVMIEQLDQLLAMNENPAVSIRVIGFAQGAHDGMRGPFVHLEFPDPGDPDVVFIENLREGTSFFSDDSVTTGRYQEIFYGLEDLAAPAEDFAVFVERVRTEMQAGIGEPAAAR